MKLGSKYNLLDTPCILFVKKYFFCIKLLHAHLQYVCNIHMYLQSVEKMAKIKTL